MFCYEIVYINNFGSLPAVQYRYPCRVIKIRVLGDNYTSFNSVADPDPGSVAFLTTGSRMGKKTGSGNRIRDEQPGSYF